MKIAHLIFTFAWRNIWRNKKRTFLLILSIIVGLLALFTAMSFMNGLSNSYFNNAINTEFSHLQIHYSDFEKDFDPKKVIQNHEEVLSFLDNDEMVSSYAFRTKTEGLIMSAKSSQGIRLYGVNPSQEESLTEMETHIVEGQYLDESLKRPIIIGEKLANKLGVKLRSKIVVTMVNANDELTSESFRVAGIINTYSSKINKTYAYIKINDFYKFYGKENLIHELAIKINDINKVESFSQNLNAKFKNNKTETWKELTPELEASIKQTELDKTLVLIVIILSFSFGLINTVFMQITERIREFGMLIANGMGRLKVFFMILTESLMIVILATVFSIFIGSLIINHFNTVGIDFSRYSDLFLSQGWSKIVHLYMSFNDYKLVFFAAIVSGLVGTVIPAVKAFRLQPVEAIRRKN